MAQTRLALGDYGAWVVVEEEEVEHYGIEVDEEAKIATCWIASTVGKHFGICVVKRHDKFTCVSDVYLDGSFRAIGTHLKHNKEPSLIAGIRFGKSSFRPFVFGALNVTENESALTAQTHEELGTIKVVISHITDYKFELSKGEKCLEFPLQEDVKIHESAKKLATHRVSFGEVQILPEVNRVVDFNRKGILATFVFRYRPLDMLKALDKAPSDHPPAETEGPSAPGPVSGKRKAALIEEPEEKPIVDISDPEDQEEDRTVEQLGATLRSCLAELEKIKQSRLDRRQGKHATKKVKHEPKAVTVLPGEIIDLTI